MGRVELCECASERAAILEYDGELSREQAERSAFEGMPYCDECKPRPVTGPDLVYETLPHLRSRREGRG